MATESTGQAAGEAAAQSGGMPQLDFSSWPSQIFWTALALFILYKVLNGSIPVSYTHLTLPTKA